MPQISSGMNEPVTMTEPEMMCKSMEPVADAAFHVTSGIRNYLGYFHSVNEKLKVLHKSMIPARLKYYGTSDDQKIISAGSRSGNFLLGISDYM